MKQDRTVVEDKSNDRKYFAIIPNLVDVLDLSVYAYRLYGHLKRLAGEAGTIDDPAKTATSSLAADCKMSAGKVTDAKRELLAAKLISVTEGTAARKNIRNPHVIRVLDIWQRNIEYFQSLCEQKKHLSIHHMNRTHSPGEQKEADFYSPGEILEEQEEPKIGASAPPASKKPEQPMTSTPTPTSTPKRDPVIDAFERHLQAQQKPNETIVRSWNLPPHLEQLCLWFVEDMGVTVVKGDKGKYARGASQLYEFHISREQHREICKRARAQKARDGQRITYGWPGALMEMARQVVSEHGSPRGEMKLTTVAGVEVMAEEC